MRNKQFMLYLLGIFITTIILIVFLQDNSNGNINKLIRGNESFIREFEIIGMTQKVLTDILSIDSEIHRAVMGEDPGNIGVIQNKERNVRAGLSDLKPLLTTDSTHKLLQKLDSLIEEKLKFGDSVLIALATKGGATAEEMYNSRKGKNAMGEIVSVISLLNNPRHQYLTQLAFNADRSGRRAKTWGAILAITAVLACVFTFWYITKHTGRQQQLFDQLNESEKKVREAGILKQNFMANMSHEIRTPMNAILGFTNLLQKEPLNEKSTEFVKCIEHSGENLLTIINDVLDFSKIEAGMMRIESNPFSLRELLHSIETMFATRVKQKNLRLTIDVDKSVPDILNGDAIRLTQIVVNLVNNSVKFTNTGGIYIRVIADKKNEDSIDISFSVKDTGIGIPANKMHTIFERFQQVDDDITRKYGGTGLGLSIVRQLVELQNGTISVSTVKNMGTEFIFTIPYKLSNNTAEKNKTEFTPEGEIGTNKKNIRILVVEDNVMNQNLIKHLLTDWKLDFIIANNGVEAVEALRDQRFSLVLMDIQMPWMDGYSATQKIRNELLSTIPIIAMTAHAMAGEREKCLTSGMNEYISKPIRAHELFKIINALLNRNIETENKDRGVSCHNDKIINLDYLKELSGGNTAFELNMIDQFLKQVPEEIDTMQEAFDNRNYELMKEVAHNLKTSISFMGLSEKLDEYLSLVEDSGATKKNGPVIQENITKVNKICQQAFREAREYLALNT